MKMTKLVSIIIPVYNVGNIIENCLKSVVNQTYENIEIILIDDGSTDDTYSICEKYKKNNDKIKLIHTENHGASCARNLGLELSKGDFITFIDADDYVKNDYIEKLYKLCHNNNSQISIIGVVDCYSEDGEYKNSGKNLRKTISNTTALCEMLNEKYFFAAVWGKLYSRDLWNNYRFNEKTKIGEDLEVLYKIFQIANSVSIDTYERLYFYTKYRNDSITKNGNRNDWNAEILICDKIIEECSPKNKNVLQYAIKRYIRVNYTCLVNELKNGKYDNYEKLKSNILKYKRYGIYKKFSFNMKIKLFLILHFNNFISSILRRNK